MVHIVSVVDALEAVEPEAAPQGPVVSIGNGIEDPPQSLVKEAHGAPDQEHRWHQEGGKYRKPSRRAMPVRQD